MLSSLQMCIVFERRFYAIERVGDTLTIGRFQPDIRELMVGNWRIHDRISHKPYLRISFGMISDAGRPGPDASAASISSLVKRCMAHS